MEFKNQNGADVQGSVNAKETATQQNDGKKAAANPVKTNGKAEIAKPEPAKTESVQTAPEVTTAAKAEIPPVKVVLNLESTLKLVDDLHRRSIQRVNLISRIKQLEAFEVNLTTENDELDENPYQGCKLIIEDDKQRRFITTTPGLIRLVAQFIYNACNEKLADIEAHIVFPA